MSPTHSMTDMTYWMRATLQFETEQAIRVPKSNYIELWAKYLFFRQV
ncbi:hypothetical protein SAMN06295888_11095 [Desulfonatronum zhilinae]|nr:hypothetical protein SAMN06295888_11095 [Desulfonatronum zhilinae]